MLQRCLNATCALIHSIFFFHLLHFNTFIDLILIYVDSCAAKFRCAAVGAPQKCLCWRAEVHRDVYFK